jgi:sugar/nucleoside kinase (ribokinase family)
MRFAPRRTPLTGNLLSSGRYFLFVSARTSGNQPLISFIFTQPDCIPEKMLLIAEVCPRLSVLSPNHTEALAMFGKISSPYLSDHQVSAFYPSTDGMKAEIENVAKSLLELLVAKDTPTPGPGWDRGVIVRCGAMGCCIVRKRYLVSGDDDDNSEEAKPQWIEAYWTASASPDFRNHIVDVTGGGNAFLGGLAAGMKLTNGDLRECTSIS